MGKYYVLPKKVNDKEWVKCKVPKMVMREYACKVELGDGYCKKYGKIPVFIQKLDEETFKLNFYGFIYGVDGSFESCASFAEKYLKEENRNYLLKELCLLFRYVNRNGGIVSKSDYMGYVSEIRKQP